MKNLNLFLLLAFAIFQVSCCRNFVRISDAAFEEYLIDNNFDKSKILDGKISNVDADSIQSLIIDSLHSIKIKDLNGIQYFKNLKTLRASYSQVFEISGSGNPLLETLECYHCQNLTKLDVFLNDSLKEIGFWPAKNISSLRLGNKPNLKIIDGGESKIDGLNVTNCPKLENLQCFGWRIKSLNLTQNKNLTALNCDGDTLSELDLSQNTKLKYLEIYRTKISKIDVSLFKDLIVLSCGETNVSELNFTNNCNNLLVLQCQGLININTLDLAQKPYLTNLLCNGIYLPNLDISKNTKLKEIQVVNTQMKKLDISLYPNLEVLDCSGTKISKLNFTNNCDSLKKINCQGLNIDTLDLSNKPKLIYAQMGNPPNKLYVCVDDTTKIPPKWSRDNAYIIYKKCTK